MASGDRPCGRKPVEGVGIHAAPRATRVEALDPIRHGVQARFGAMVPRVVAGLALRHCP